MQNQERGMKFSDAIKLIQRINWKVDLLGQELKMGSRSQKNQGMNMEWHRKALRWKFRRIIYSALFNGRLVAMGEDLRSDDMLAEIQEKDLQRKIRKASVMVELKNQQLQRQGRSHTQPAGMCRTTSLMSESPLISKEASGNSVNVEL